MRALLLATLLLPGLALAERSSREDNADAPPSTPEAQRAMFHLPPGFEIQLVAAEPEIQKPMNLNFDAAGRLWVTGSELYPWPAKVDALGQPIANFDETWKTMSGAFDPKKAPVPPEKATDSVRVLSDFGPDGRARKVEVFADGLNIPIGVQPLPRQPGAKGDSAIVFSIPKIWRFTDSDGDGRADLREPLYGDFGFRDTHGMSSNYLYWVDGWIYGCHGFANHSVVKDGSGNVTEMNSGNTYRFRPDGSCFEIYTHGQTNPFGLTVDDWGNFYTADSHSKPVMMLIPGAYYAGIGKTHDGLGFAPTIMDHDHGSSSIAGVAWYGADHFPAEYRGNTFNGNPVTRRINRDRYEWHGSTPKAIEMPDFLTCDDPWFRPVQVKVGPDGALWIADFYNPIIGHYEQPLSDPRRDHKHGRIWRVVYRGEKGDAPAPALPDLAKLDAKELFERRHDTNITTRMLAVAELSERKGELAKLGPGHWEVRHDTPTTPYSKRQSIQGMASSPAAGNLDYLLLALADTKDDPALTHSIRVALRETLSMAGAYAVAKEELQRLPESDTPLAEVSLAVRTPDAAGFLLGHLQRAKFTGPRVGDYLRHAVRHLPEQKLGEVSALLLGSEGRTAARPSELALADALGQGARERGWNMPEGLTAWMRSTVFAALESPDAALSDRAVSALREAAWPEKFSPLRRIVLDAKRNGNRRSAALEATLNVEGGITLAAHALGDSSSLPLRKKAAEFLGRTSNDVARAALTAALPSAPAELALSITASLAKTDADFTALLDVIEAGKASAGPLRNRLIAILVTQRAETLRARADALTKDLPPEDARLDQVIAARVKTFGGAKTNLAKGAEIYAQQCAVCHRFRGQGGNVGPNLDGVAARGAHRLIEDILDPNRNVDPTFRQTTLELKDGRVMIGANLREEGGAILLTDAAGQTQSAPKVEVKSQTQSRLSLMPPAFETTISAEDLNFLLAYLLQP